MNSFITNEQKTRYLLRRNMDLAKLSAAHEEEKYDLLLLIGHQLQGNAASFGYSEFSDLGKMLEQAGKEKNLILAAKATGSLKKALSDAISALD